MVTLRAHDYIHACTVWTGNYHHVILLCVHFPVPSVLTGDALFSELIRQPFFFLIYSVLFSDPVVLIRVYC